MNGLCFVTGQHVIDLTEFGFNDTTRQPLWVFLCRLPEKGRREIGKGDEREGQGRKENE